MYSVVQLPKLADHAVPIADGFTR